MTPRRTVIRSPRPALAGCLAIALGTLLVGTAAQAAKPPVKSIPLTAGKSPLYDKYLPLVGSSKYLVYTKSVYPYASRTVRSRNRHGTTSTLRFIPGHKQLPTSLAGSSLTAADTFTSKRGIDHNDVAWWRLAKGTTGKLRLPLHETYLGSAPDGVLAITSTGSMQDYPSSGAPAANLSKPFPASKHGTGFAVSGDNGVLLLGRGDRAVYMSWRHPGSYTRLDVGADADVTCSSLIAGSAGCSATDATHHPVIIRASLAGAPPVITHLSKSACPSDVYVTPMVTGWDDGCAGTVDTVPAATGTPVSTGTAHVIAGRGLLGAYGELVVAEHPGVEYILDAATSATSPRYPVARAIRSPVAAAHLAITAGRVAYYDDEHGTVETWSRTVGGTPTTVSVGPPTSLGRPGSGTSIGAGGSRRLGISGATTVAAGTQSGLSITSPIRRLTIDPKQSVTNVDASGDRVTFVVKSRFRPQLYDLRTGQQSSLSQAVSASLWGNYLAYAKADGSVWRQQLGGHHKPVRLRGPLAHVAPGSIHAALLSYGDEVAWRLTAAASTPAGVVTIDGFRNAATLAPARSVPAADIPVSASSNGLLERHTVGNVAGYYLQRYGSALRTEVLAVAQSGDLPAASDAIGVDGDRIAWIDVAYQAHIAALPITASPDRPRFLGDALAPAKAQDLATTPWRAFVPLSADLTTCAVTIYHHATRVRTLSCAKHDAHLGDAVVTWNGKNAAGVAMSPGRYQWRLHAANRDGTALAANGGHAPISGGIVVR